MKHWAVVALDEPLPHSPMLVSPFKWYARYVCLCIADPAVVVIPWQVRTEWRDVQPR